jgi:hypothetical protein
MSMPPRVNPNLARDAYRTLVEREEAAAESAKQREAERPNARTVVHGCRMDCVWCAAARATALAVALARDRALAMKTRRRERKCIVLNLKYRMY